MSFEKLGVFKPLLDAIKDLGYENPTTIQKRAIPLVLQKKDIFATAQTGTGKTAAFALPILQRLKKSDKNSGVRAVILSPTRELSIQIYEDIENFSKYMDIQTAILVGGKDIEKQRRRLRRGVDIIIATPGRLMEHMLQGLYMDDVEVFVLDEADRMLDMGFAKDIREIHPLLPKKHQTLLFSATFSDKVRKLSKLILRKPAFIETAKKNTTVDTINQVAYRVDTARKAELLAYIIGSRNFEQVLVFTRTKVSADELFEELQKDGLKCGVIHGDKTKANRLKTLKQFKEKKIRVLIATDIASRGLDIEHLPYVINYELPSIPEDYVHRVGRTGRAGRDGEAITLIDIYEKFEIRDIEKLIGQKIPQEEVEGFEPDPTIRRKDKDEVKLKSEHKIAAKKHIKHKSPEKKVTAKSLKMAKKKRKTTKRDPR
jgi:ATP-dependent RNA helicase RhlE